MSGRGIVEVRPITMYEARAILERELEDSEEPLYEQKICLDYLNKFARLSPEEGRRIVEEVLKVSDKIRPEIAVKIADLLPRDEEDVRAIFAKERAILDREEIARIVEICAPYIKE
ncbi:MAG: DNA-directed RNA polymerase subunit F [Euryarchaeota archaeon]|nr:DNA-directed RNA polymerase subunit F [Euryarchaeota archaeon]